MSINIRAKGQEGEREIAAMLNTRISEIHKRYKLPPIAKKDAIFQRNQNQSAVGGYDLSNNLNLAIEIKRQENLSISTWWKQCLESAKRSDAIPVLMFRQNRRPWRVMMLVDILGFPGVKSSGEEWGIREFQVEFGVDNFLDWFEVYYCRFLKNGRVSN